MKRTSFLGVSSRRSYVFIELFNFSFFSISGRGIDLDYHDIEWFALEMNRDHSVIFEIASKDYILDSFVDYDGYSISSKGFLPTGVDVMVSSVQYSCSVMSDSLQTHELQHSRPLCPSRTPTVHPNPCPLSRWCHRTISSSVVPFSSCPQSFPASGSFPMSQLFTSGGQSIGVSASSVLPMNTQDWSPLGWIGWISLQSKGLSRVFSNTTLQKHQFFGSAFFIIQLSLPYMTTGKTIVLTRWTFVDKVMSLLF